MRVLKFRQACSTDLVFLSRAFSLVLLLTGGSG